MPEGGAAGQKFTVELTVDDETVPVRVEQGGSPSAPATLPATPTIAAGEFAFRATLASTDADRVRTFRLRFTGPLIHLHAPDNRPVAAQLSYLGFELPPSRLDGFPPGAASPLHNRELKAAGLWEDGWVAPELSLRLTQPAGPGQLVINGQVPRIGDNSDHQAQVELTIDGRPVPVEVTLAGVKMKTATVGLGDFTIRAAVEPAEKGAATHIVRLRFIGPSLRLPAPDDRTVAAQLRSLGFEKPK